MLKWGGILLGVALLCACTKAFVVTPQNIKRGKKRLIVHVPVPMLAPDMTMEIMLVGNDRHYPQVCYMTVAVGPYSSGAIIYPRQLRYHKVNVKLPPYRLNLAVSVKVYEVTGFAWDGRPELGPPLLKQTRTLPLLGLVAEGSRVPPQQPQPPAP